MPDSHEHGPATGGPASTQPHYETADVNFGPIIKFGIGLAVAGIVIHLAILGTYALLAHNAKNAQPRLSALEEKDRVQLPKDLGAIPEPRLQVSDVGDLKEFRQQQKKKLDTYGWIDEKKGVVHIPIDQAIKILSDPKQQAAHGIVTSAKK
jgi:hypothetical protein